MVQRFLKHEELQEVLQRLFNEEAEFMNRAYLEKMLALILVTYAIALLAGEAIRDVRLAKIEPDKKY